MEAFSSILTILHRWWVVHLDSGTILPIVIICATVVWTVMVAVIDLFSFHCDYCDSIMVFRKDLCIMLILSFNFLEKRYRRAVILQLPISGCSVWQLCMAVVCDCPVW